MAATPRQPSDGSAVVAIDVTPMLFPPTGIPRSVIETVRALQGLAVGPRLVPFALGLRSPLLRARAPAGTRYVPVPTQALLRLWCRSEHPTLDWLVRGSDVLHATNFLTPPSRLPTLVTVHDLSFARHPETVTPVVRSFEHVLRRAAARGASFHTPTEAVGDEVEELFGPGLRAAGRIVAVPWGLPDMPTAGPLSGEVAAAVGGAPYILSIATLDPRKNIDVLVRAFGELADPSLRLVLAGGDGLGSDAVTAAIAALGPAGSRVVRTGLVSEDDRVALLAGARVLAYPSRYEGFGIPVLEAMALGIPVVAGDNPAVAEVSAGAALLADPSDPIALARQLAVAVDDEAERARLIAAGRARAADFTWESTAERLSAVYIRLARGLAAAP
jgi:glycosyltransferase involved in cell wall biosynthesis